VRRTVLLLCLLVALSQLGCAGGEDLKQRAQDARARAVASGHRIVGQMREALDRMRRSVPQATRDDQAPVSRDRDQAGTVPAFLSDVLNSVDRYWTRTLEASGFRAPRVSYLWIPPGRVARTGCGIPAGDDAAFYCPADDTIYVAERMAAAIWRGAARDLPGERAGYGHAVGDFGLAYVVAHEYAHNVQQEVGLARVDPRYGVEPLELQADCMAGLWGNSVYREGRLKPGDVEEAISTVMAVGDFDTGNPQHHGTPEQRRAAWLLGYRTGNPQRCVEATSV
jgi:predicted metalloprotease